jgi:hypothetical protein
MESNARMMANNELKSMWRDCITVKILYGFQTFSKFLGGFELEPSRKVLRMLLTQQQCSNISTIGLTQE